MVTRASELLDEIGAEVRRFVRLETSAAILLLLATLAAMTIKNSPIAGLYSDFLMLEGQVRIGAINLEKALFLWVNDGWMALFFFLVGLEIKYEVIYGHLKDRSQLVLPAAGALGGVVVPALIYAGVNWDDPVALKGWAVPTATDIAFALGVLALLGSRVPVALKVFLMTLAIIDDLVAIVVIAFFYTSGLSLASLVAAGLCVLTLVVLNRLGIHRLGPYVLVGLILWVCVLKSGVHATLAGVVTALLIPSWQRTDGVESIHGLVEDLHPWIAFGILPGFAFVNAGIDFQGMNFEKLLNGVPLGIALGLVVGKSLGVFAFAQAAIKLGWAKFPDGVDSRLLFGVAILCGIGFTMSFFIGGLAFAEGGAGYSRIDRLGIIVGSLVSAIAGYLYLRRALAVPATSSTAPG
ncbi:MAG: Na+/H+ antiporter NhaA [Gammaproteobacteria bacterium]|nr:Na+/H+ antiporter NhaA [Gammaproteobacteria bacterium]